MRNLGVWVIALCALFFVFIVGRCSVTRHSSPVRDTLTVFDTVRYIEPQFTVKNVVRYEVRRLPRFRDYTIDLTLPIRDTLTVIDTIPVVVPIEQVEYRTDEYYAVVEGYLPRLVQLDIYRATQTITETVTKRKRWGVSVGVQMGYGITPAGMQPYAGLGANIGINF